MLSKDWCSASVTVKLPVLFEGGNWDKLITFRLSQLEAVDATAGRGKK
jgi:hypothetical protein